MGSFGIVWVSRGDNGLYIVVLLVIFLILIISLIFGKTNILKKIFDRYSSVTDKVKFPISFGPDIFEFITMCAKFLLNIFRK